MKVNLKLEHNRKMAKGVICLAIHKRGKKDYVIRIGCTSRSGRYWLSRYKSEGFKNDNLSVVNIINETSISFTLEQYKEMFIYDLAGRLEDANITVNKLSDYKYQLRDIKVVKQYLKDHEGGYIIPKEEEDKENKTYRSVCSIM